MDLSATSPGQSTLTDLDVNNLLIKTSPERKEIMISAILGAGVKRMGVNKLSSPGEKTI
jgi:hypothetical protein